MPITIRTSMAGRVGITVSDQPLIVSIGRARISVRTQVESPPHRSGVLSAGGSGILALVAGGTISAVLNATGAASLAVAAGATIAGALTAAGSGTFFATNLLYATGALAAAGAGGGALVARMTVGAVLSGGGIGGSAAVATMTKAASLTASGAGVLAVVSRAIRTAVLAGSGTGAAPLIGGSAGPAVDFVDRNAYKLNSPAPATAFYKVLSNGDDFADGEGTNLWLISGLTSEFEIRATPNGGTVSAGSAATNSWLTPTSDLIWFKTRPSGIGIAFAALTMECRLAAAPFTVIDTWEVTLTAETE